MNALRDWKVENMHALLSAWQKFELDRAPYVLPGDETILSNTDVFCRFAGWDGLIADPEFGTPASSRLHVDLLPIPFVRNLRSASVFLLMLNPGFGPHDYFGEYRVPEYRAALIDNLHQSRTSSFLFLDPRFSWHGGYDYWHTKLRSVIASFAGRVAIPYGRARQFFQSHIAAIELSPYHSVNFKLPGRVFNSLRSVQLARAFVHEELLPLAKSGDCLLIVTRAVSNWRLPAHDNVVAYSATEARSAHLSERSRGGAAILQFITSTYAKSITRGGVRE
jgi:hypothetical protein